MSDQPGTVYRIAFRRRTATKLLWVTDRETFFHLIRRNSEDAFMPTCEHSEAEKVIGTLFNAESGTVPTERSPK